MGFIYDNNITIPNNKTDGNQPSVPTSWVAADANLHANALLDTRTAITGGDYHGLRDMSGGLPPLSPSGGVQLISNAGALWKSSDGGAYEAFSIPGVWPDASAIYDIRAYGAVPGAAGKTATTAAFNAIFADINWGYFPDTSGKRTAVIYVPAGPDDSGWYIGDVIDYVGSPGAGIYMKGDAPTARSGVSGSNIVFDGTPGGTMFSFLGINGSTFENIGFDLGGKALVGLKLAQKWYGAPHNSQIPSNGATFRNCFFFNPQGDYNSILVQAGDDTDPPNTLQASDYFFYNCWFLGHNTIQGWGFKTIVSGNTKNFIFDSCNFGFLYRCIEAYSGFLTIRGLEAGNIGYDRDSTACLVHTGAAGTDITGGGFENGGTGYFARVLIATQAAPVHMAGFYADVTAPADDYVVSTSGPTHIEACHFSNNRTTATALPWTALSPVFVGQQRLNDSGKWYVCTTGGTTGNAGGPTGTGTNIADGATVKWDWVTSSPSNIAKFLAGETEPTGFYGSVIYEALQLPYITTPITAFPVFDGNNNPLGAALGNAGTDYAKSVSHRIYARGNLINPFSGGGALPLLDFDGLNTINQRDQFWTDNLTTGTTVLRNDTGVYIITVPASVIAAQGVGVVNIGNMPPGYRLSDCIIDVATIFSGPGVTGPKASIGNLDVGNDDILLAGAIDATGQIGLVSADRGAGWDSNRYIVPFDSVGQPYLILKCTVTGGVVADINAGSLNVYVQFQRLKV